MTDPHYLHTISMTELYQTAYQSRPPIIDGLLYAGTYILAGVPKIGKSFLVAQIAYHVSTGKALWDYEVQPAGDSFEMISGTTGLLGCADGSLLMQKKKRTALEATIDVVGRDQQDQILYLEKDADTQIWNLEKV